MLNLAEYKEFCKIQSENLGKRLGITLKPISEEEMEIAFNANRFEGKEGITLADHTLKTNLEKRLMREKTFLKQV